MPVVTVLVADNHPVYREGIVRAVNETDGMRIVAECGDGDEAHASIRRFRPQVAVLDRRMPGLDAIDVLDALARDGIETRVMILSAFSGRDDVGAVLEAGAAGYVVKDATRSAICGAIRRVAGGETVIGREAQQAVAAHLRAARDRQSSFLSDRELEVLRLLADGLSSKALAERLVLGESTIKTHQRHLYAKLEVGDRAAAVAEGLRRGLIR